MAEIRINGKKIGLVNGKKVRAIHYGLKTFYPTYEEEVKPTVFVVSITDNNKQPRIRGGGVSALYSVDWGDGETQTITTYIPGTGTVFVKQTPYNSNGEYTVKVLAKDITQKEEPYLYMTISGSNYNATTVNIKKGYILE